MNHNESASCSKNIIAKKWYNIVLKTRNNSRFFYIIRHTAPFIDNTGKVTIFKTIRSAARAKKVKN